MKLLFYSALFLFPLLGLSQENLIRKPEQYPPVEKVASDLKRILTRPMVDFAPSFTSYKTDSVILEKGFFYSEKNEKVPVLIYKPAHSSLTSFPVVICLHGTGGNKEDVKGLLEQLARSGIMGVAIDARFHGERIAGGAHHSQEYVKAIITAWENKDTRHQDHPFYFDTVYDLWRLTDYLVTRPDVQAKRIGMMGISMGGIETWMAASVDKRIKVIVPVIAIQSFKWSLENNQWQGRAHTIWEAHEQAAKDVGDSGVNKENIKLLWNKLLPGITGEFDCPSMIRLFAPRPLLLLNNENDMNCPLPGARVAFEAARKSYRGKNAAAKLKIHITPDQPHRFLPEHEQMTLEWFKKWL